MKKLDETMGRLGFVKSEADECLYVLCKDGQVTLLVDDAALTSQEITQITKFKKAISEHFPM
jgi:hypothetical protein